MKYNKIRAKEKPTEAPGEFCVFDVGGELFVFCPVRGRAYKVNNKPEEIVRQWWLYRLNAEYGYKFDQMGVEVPIKVGAAEAKKAADIVVYNSNSSWTPRIFVEVKKPNRKDGIDQLQVYMNATGCRIGLWSNGNPPHVYLLRMEPNAKSEEATWRELRNIPRKNESLADVDSPMLRRDLEPVHDFVSLFLECEDHIKAHEGVNAFDEIFKLIFSKLYDERRNLKNDTSPATFRVGALESASAVRDRIEALFRAAKNHWVGVFDQTDNILLGDESLAFSVSALQKAYLLKSDTDALGAAFELMINPGMKGDKGQYFTPRHVVKMCIDILDPQENETIFDPACGSGGFLIYAMDKIFREIESDRDDDSEILEAKKDYASSFVYGMDYDRTLAKIAKAYMLIWGDGRSNISVADALNESYWDQNTKVKFSTQKGKGSAFKKFDIIATNPPFAGDIKAENTLSRYRLAYNNKGGRRARLSQVSRDILFIERCIEFLAPGGRMAIVVPRGLLKNYNDERVREHILQRCSVIAVVGLSGEMFKPYTNTKTCVLFLKKRRNIVEKILELRGEPKIVFAQTTKPGKDKSGRLTFGKDGLVDTDLREITSFIKAKSDWKK